MITALNFTDFLYRPRRPEELVTDAGGGVVFSQAAHQIDIARLLGGGAVKSVRASAGAWDPARPTEGAYSAHLTFEGGAFASLIYSGYARFDSDEFCGWINEMGAKKDPRPLGDSRRRILAMAGEEQEALLKNERNYGGSAYIPPQPTGGHPAVAHQQFGLFLVSCDGGDLRPSPNGVMIYDDRGERLDALPPPAVPRREVIDELYDAVVSNRPPVHSGQWAMATIEVCLAILQSSRQGAEILLKHQVGLRSD
jgi:phthalate 4,5-cis-dihydrodiol dehydrogenase